MIKVSIVDDHAVVREGLKKILAETTDIVVVDEASNGREVLKKLNKREYDVILLDISMPGQSGLDVLQELKEKRFKGFVLILSIYPEEHYAVRALKGGAAGYLTKESAPDELIRAIRKVAAGGKYVSSALAEKLASDLEFDEEVPLHETLSYREHQVMCMIASGKRTKKIAEELSLSIKTIHTYRSRILEKMRLRHNADIIRYAIHNRLVE